jgi:hypothetical protein
MDEPGRPVLLYLNTSPFFMEASICHLISCYHVKEMR